MNYFATIYSPILSIKLLRTDFLNLVCGLFRELSVSDSDSEFVLLLLILNFAFGVNPALKTFLRLMAWFFFFFFWWVGLPCF